MSEPIFPFGIVQNCIKLKNRASSVQTLFFVYGCYLNPNNTFNSDLHRPENHGNRGGQTLSLALLNNTKTVFYFLVSSIDLRSANGLKVAVSLLPSSCEV